MITTIVKFPLPAKLDYDTACAAFENVAPMFRSIVGLHRKQFLLAQDGTFAGGVYLWRDLESAQNYITSVLTPMIQQNYGVEPTVEYLHSPVVVDTTLAVPLFNPKVES